MHDAVLIQRGGGEVVGDSRTRRVEILSEDDAVHATWSRFGPHRDGADLHIHRHHADLFYVLDGELTVRLGHEGTPTPLAAGMLALVPPLVVHGFRNGSDAEVRYLNFHAPGEGFADFLRGLRDGRSVDFDQHPPPPNGTRPPADAAIGDQLFVSQAAGMRVTLLADVEAIAMSECRREPGGSWPPHVHRRHVESFYVLHGELTFTAAERELRAAAGSWVQIPAGVPHTFAVSGGGPARFLEIHTPSCGYGGFVRGFSEERAAFDQVSA